MNLILMKNLRLHTMLHTTRSYPDNIVDISKDLSELNEVPNEPIDLNISNLIPDVKQVNMGDDTNNLAKMTIKELNEIIKEKGLKTNKTMKKQDIIDLIEKSE